LGRRVAVKLILPNLSTETRFHERFLSEARSVAALEHENVLPIYDFGDAGGEPYLVMPFLENGTLAERLEQGEVTPAQAIEWIRQLASALDAAHEAGVLHRDVKPANVMLGGGGRLLLADFGIAKSDQSGDLTATGIALGTPAYMAPELARGEGATSASDRYALGVLAYELLCGRPPFVGDNALALLHQHLTTPVPAVITARPDLPEDLDPAFARILAKDPAARPVTCAALAGEIARAFGGSVEAVAPITVGPRAARPIGAEDATLAARVSHGAATPATRVADRPAPSIMSVDSAARTPAPATRYRPAAIAAAPFRRNAGIGLETAVTTTRRGRGAQHAGGALACSRSRGGRAGFRLRRPYRHRRPIQRGSTSRTGIAGGFGWRRRCRCARRPLGDATGRCVRHLRSGGGRLAPRTVRLRAVRQGRSTLSVDAIDQPESRRRPPREVDCWRSGVGRRRSRHGAAIAAEFLALQHPPDWVTLLPTRFLARHPGPPPEWQVALFWADPRNEARALVESALAKVPNDRNLMLARAVVDHLDGEHAEAARKAIALEPQVRQGRVRQVVARFAGDQLLWSGEVATAISWYKRLLIAPDRTEIGAVLRTLSQEGGPQLVARACADGFAPACEAGRSPGGPRSRRARPQP
jgi:serine/threonine-protein kinase